MIEDDNIVGPDENDRPSEQPETPPAIEKVGPDLTPEESEESEGSEELDDEGRKTLEEFVEELTPNVRLSADRADEALPEGPVVIGTVQIEIPDKPTQLKGFYTADASILVAQFRQYKFFTPKGKKAPSVSI